MKILKILLVVGFIIGSYSVVIAKPSFRVFDEKAIIGVEGDTKEVATSTGINIDGVTTIGFAWLTKQGTSTPHVGIGYQTSMNNSSWTATTRIITDTSAVVYTATDTALTLHPTEWIRWIISNAVDNATGTAISLWMKIKNEGEK